MSGKTNSSYHTPKVTTYGTVETMTEAKNKAGEGTDEFSSDTPLTGSVF